MLITIVTVALLMLSFVFFLGGSIGILRLPDFYSRLHAAGMLDTMGLILSMIGLAVFAIFHHFSMSSLLTGIKILLIFVFVFLTSPTATHAIVDAGMRAGMRPWRKSKTRRGDA
ncbi:MAG: sodium:proton antiporter [Deltaproteobacteria bacterium]|nr:MAG: sodium:proton antiporter [Deltaproteobacteria bacterium]